MKKFLVAIGILGVLASSLIGCKPVDDISYIDSVDGVMWRIEWGESNRGRGGILTDEYIGDNGALYIEGYYIWYGSIKGWVYHDGIIIIRAPSVTIIELTKEDKK